MKRTLEVAVDVQPAKAHATESYSCNWDGQCHWSLVMKKDPQQYTDLRSCENVCSTQCMATNTKTAARCSNKKVSMTSDFCKRHEYSLQTTYFEPIQMFRLVDIENVIRANAMNVPKLWPQNVWTLVDNATESIPRDRVMVSFQRNEIIYWDGLSARSHPTLLWFIPNRATIDILRYWYPTEEATSMGREWKEKSVEEPVDDSSLISTMSKFASIVMSNQHVVDKTLPVLSKVTKSSTVLLYMLYKRQLIRLMYTQQLLKTKFNVKQSKRPTVVHVVTGPEKYEPIHTKGSLDKCKEYLSANFHVDNFCTTLQQFDPVSSIAGPQAYENLVMMEIFKMIFSIGGCFGDKLMIGLPDIKSITKDHPACSIVHQHVLREVETCSDARVLIVPISVVMKSGGHAMNLVIRTRTKVFFVFDPNGFIQNDELYQFSEALYKVMELSGLNYTPSKAMEICPIGPQYYDMSFSDLEGNSGGYCVAWSMLFMLVYLCTMQQDHPRPDEYLNKKLQDCNADNNGKFLVQRFNGMLLSMVPVIVSKLGQEKATLAVHTAALEAASSSDSTTI